MKHIGINLGAYHKGLSVAEEIGILHKLGFTRAFIVSENEKLPEYAAEMKKCDIKFENFHAPFSHINDMWLPTEDENGEKMLARLCRAVDCCVEYDARLLVVHLSSGENAPRISDSGVLRFDRLMAYAKEKGVRIAYENQRKLASLAFALEGYPDAVFCWDTGHEACFTQNYSHAPMFPSRLAALHLHSNLGEYNRDLHLLPFDGALDMDKIARSLAASAYRGPIMLEVITSNSDHYDGLSAEEYYRRAYAQGVRFAELVEKYEKRSVTFDETEKVYNGVIKC